MDSPVLELFGCRYPFVLAGMGGVARSELVAAVTEAGGFGFLGMVREPPQLIRREVEALRARGIGRFGVNLIPAATSPDLLEREVATVMELGVPVVALFWDIDERLVRRLTDAGILVVYQVGSVEEGIAASRAGARVLIAQGVEAGGHVRATRRLHDTLPRLVEAVDVPVLAAGGITDGGDVVTAFALGAAGVVLGTAMIATTESFAHDYHKQRLLEASAADTVLTETFHVNWPDGAPVRVLASEVTEGRLTALDGADGVIVGWDEGRPIRLFSTDSPLRSTTGNLGSMALYAGMGVGRITKLESARDRLTALVGDVEARLAPYRPADAGGGPASPVCYLSENPSYMGFLDDEETATRLRQLLADTRAALRRALISRPDRAGERRRRLERWALTLGGLVGDRPAVGQPARPGNSDETEIVRRLRETAPWVVNERVRIALDGLLADLDAVPLAGRELQCDPPVAC